MSNSLDPDQARRFVGPDLGPNCLQRLSADDTGRQTVKTKQFLTVRGRKLAVDVSFDPTTVTSAAVFPICK